MMYFTPSDALANLGMGDGTAPMSEKAKMFQQALDMEAAAKKAAQPTGVATGGPVMAAPDPVQTVAAAMPQPTFGAPPMQQPQPMMGGFAGVQLPRFR